MNITDVLYDSGGLTLSDIKHHCQYFLMESKGQPLYKNLTYDRPDQSTLKLRHRSKKQLDECFSSAFDKHIHHRSLKVHTSPQQLNDADDLYYIFPYDGYKYAYNTNVVESEMEYNEMLSEMSEMWSESDAKIILADMLKLSYKSTKLFEQEHDDVEVLIYNTPKFITLRASLIDYEELYQIITK